VPVGPWHIAHLAAKTWAPCFTVPCPEGRPSPVGDTSMFQARISSSVAVRPSPYPPPSSADPAVQKHHARPIASVPMPISTDLGFRHAPAAAPPQPANLVKTGVDLLPPRGRGDHRLRLHHQTELIRLAVGHEIGVLRRLFARHKRSGAELQPPEPLHVDIAFVPWQEQAQRIALLRPERFPILAVADHGLLQDFISQRNAPVHARGVASLPPHP